MAEPTIEDSQDSHGEGESITGCRQSNSSYFIHHRMVDKYGDGRVFCGDAAFTAQSADRE
jgi:hypothetical protein